MTHLAQSPQLAHRPRQLLGLGLQRARPLLDPLFERPVGLLQPLLVATALVEERLERAPHGIEVARQVSDLVPIGRIDRRVEIPTGDEAGRLLQRQEGAGDVAPGDEHGGRINRGDDPHGEGENAGDIPEDRLPDLCPGDGQPDRADGFPLVRDVGGRDQKRG